MILYDLDDNMDGLITLKEWLDYIKDANDEDDEWSEEKYFI